MYTGYEITEKSKAEILSKFKTKYPDVICHHITEAFGVSEDAEAPAQPESIQVVGYAFDDDKRVECLLVEVDGTTRRPSGGQYHITLSIDREFGAKPVQSNHILYKAEPVEPFAVEATSKVMK